MTLSLDEAAMYRVWVGEWVRPEAQRLALCVLWPKHTLAEARTEMRMAVRRAITPKGWAKARDEALGVAIRRWAIEQPDFLGALHDDTGTIFDQFEDKHPWSHEWSAFADALLDQAIGEMEAVHATSRATLQETATAALRAGQDRDGVVQAVLAQARGMLPLPPPDLVQGAIERAAKEHRFEARFWTNRRRRG